jgi:hypothetical protein
MQKRKKAAFSIILLMTMLLVSAIQPLAVHAQIEEEVYAGGYFYTTNGLHPMWKPTMSAKPSQTLAT